MQKVTVRVRREGLSTYAKGNRSKVIFGYYNSRSHSHDRMKHDLTVIQYEEYLFLLNIGWGLRLSNRSHIFPIRGPVHNANHEN